MPTEIRLVVSEDPIIAMEKFAKSQKGKNGFHDVFESSFTKVELHRPQQVTIDPQFEELTTESPIVMLPLDTKTLNALKHAHTSDVRGKGKTRTTDIVRERSMDITSVGQLLEKTEADLKQYHEIGPKRIEQIKEALRKCNPDFVLRQPQESLPI
jgi:hypothetical protein